jgi:beta-phosphoglucomutase-like phosphatase (HAD superfamily)
MWVMAIIEAAFFDSDGTLLDTKEYIYGAFKATFTSRFGIALEDAVLGQVSGKSLRESHETLGRMFGLNLTEAELLECKRMHRKFQADNPDLVKAFPGALQTIERIKRNGIKVAVVTSRTGTAKELLRLAGLLSVMDAVVTGDDVHRHKPDPEGILIAAELLGVRTKASFYTGDSIVDVQAGKTAGVKATIAAGYGLDGPERLRQAQPDYMISHIAHALRIILAKG